jgi:thioesterase domain-containing protein
VHPAAGLSWPFIGLARHLDPDQPIYGLQARGFNSEGALPASIEDIAEDYVQQIRTVQPTGPYHLVGWSFGGLVAHAMATRLQAEGERVELLAVLDGYPLAHLGITFATGPETGAHLDREVDNIHREVALATNLPEAQISQRMSAMFANHMRLTQEFVPARLRGDLLLFTATPRPEAIDDGPLPTAADWAPYVDGEVETHPISCDHDQMLRPTGLDTIGPLLAKRLTTRRQA